MMQFFLQMGEITFIHVLVPVPDNMIVLKSCFIIMLYNELVGGWLVADMEMVSLQTMLLGFTNGFPR